MTPFVLNPPLALSDDFLKRRRLPPTRSSRPPPPPPPPPVSSRSCVRSSAAWTISRLRAIYISTCGLELSTYVCICYLHMSVDVICLCLCFVELYLHLCRMHKRICVYVRMCVFACVRMCVASPTESHPLRNKIWPESGPKHETCEQHPRLRFTNRDVPLVPLCSGCRTQYL